MKTFIKNNKGFTLIELLVVIAIIGILSSTLFASLSSARVKAKDAAIKEEVFQLANLMALNYNDYGSFCQLQANGWITAQSVTCSGFSGIYASQAQAICNNIYNNAKDVDLGGGGSYRIYPRTLSYSCDTEYSFMVALNNGNWYCSGSSGRKGEYASYSGSSGCFNNP
jgi:type IV pilus assembly protein PilA